MCPSRSPALLASWTPRSNHEERLDESDKGSRLPLGTLVPGVPSIPPHRRSSPDSPRRARGGVGERPVQLLNEGLRTRLFTLDSTRCVPSSEAAKQLGQSPSYVGDGTRGYAWVFTQQRGTEQNEIRLDARTTPDDEVLPCARAPCPSISSTRTRRRRGGPAFGPNGEESA